MNVAPSPYLLEAFQNKGFQNLTYIPNTIEIINYPFLKRKVYAPKLLWVRAFADIYNPILALEVFSLLNAYNDAVNARKREVQSLVQSAVSQLNTYHQLVLSGELTESQAQERALLYIILEVAACIGHAPMQ